MWLKIEKTKEFIPVNEQSTEKVFLDGANGWCILQKNGRKYYIDKKQREALDEEIDREVYWARKRVEDSVKALSEDELKKVREMLKKKKEE